MTRPSTESIRVLHVDDDRNFGPIVATFLERRHDAFAVETLPTAEGVLERLDADPPIDCVVSDYQLPASDGLDLLEAVRAEHPTLPFILFTGRGSEEIASEAISAGVSDYLQKSPGDDQFALLANRIRNLVSQHRAETAVHETQKRFSRLLEHSADFIFTVNASGRIQYATPSVERVLGHPAERVIGSDAFEFIYPDDLATARDAFEDVIAEPDGETTAEFRARHADGSWRWLSVRGRNLLEDPVIEGIVVNVRDVTERTQRDHRLARERDHRSALFENTPDPIVKVVFDDEFPIIEEVNPGFEAVFGFDPDDVIGQDIQSALVPAEGRDTYEAVRQRALEGERVEEEVRRQTADGQRDFLLRVIPIVLDGEEDTAAAYTWYTDITERKVLEAELKQERRRFEALFENAQDAIALTEFVDDVPIVRAVNPTFEDTFGCDADDVLGRSLDEIVLPEGRRDEGSAITWRVIDGSFTPTEVRRPVADGERDFLLRSIPVPINGDRHFDYAVYTDITERKRSERALEVKNEQLEEFASIVSHDLRNPLDVAAGRLELATEECDSDHLEALDSALSRMSQIVTDVKTMVRHGQVVDEVAPVSLAAIAERSWATVATGDARIEIDTPPEFEFEADDARVRHLLENFFRNAIEHAGESASVRVDGLEDGFAVEDDGPGIPADDREAIFEPGFSTANGGTGFGLAIVSRVVEAHGWEIDVTGGRAGGARFEITGVEPA